MSQKEISKIMGLHQVYVSREEKKAKEKLMSLLIKNDCML
jgi:DNA-directed RNA polymerase specialized sigma subunit